MQVRRLRAKRGPEFEQQSGTVRNVGYPLCALATRQCRSLRRRPRGRLILPTRGEPEGIDRFDQVPLRGGSAQWGLFAQPLLKGTIMKIKNILLGGVAAATLGVAALVGMGTSFAADTAPTTTTNPTSSTATEKAGVEAPETAGVEKAGVSDGPGGHADANGSNVDHQFDGNE